MVDQVALAARLREIVDDPSWPGWYRVEAKCWGAEGLEPASLSDDDLRAALRVRMLARPVDRAGSRDPEEIRRQLAEWARTGRRPG